ncbi:MAG: thioester domain-containing protein [Pelodictyon phaeoclathratiforme]
MKTILYAIIAVAIMTMSGMAHATEVINLHIGGSYSNIKSIVNGVQKSEGGGSIDPSFLNTRALKYLYCVDLFTPVYVNADYPYTTVNNSAIIHGNLVENAGKVAYLLGNYGIGGQGEQAIALQAAIWHVVNKTGVYDLDIASYGSTSNIATLYNKYINEATTNSSNVSKFLWINPGKDVAGLTNYQGLVSNSPNPEPSTYVLLCLGGLFVAFRLRKSSGTSAVTV